MNNILELLTPEQKKLIKTKPFQKGKIIFLEHEQCIYLGIIISGEIKISSVTMDGSEIIYNSLSKGDIFGNNLIFSNDSKYRGDVIATSDSLVGFIDKKSLLFILQNNEKFLIKYLEIQSDFGKKLNFQMKLLSFSNAKDRFLYFLSMNNNYIKFDSVSSLANKLFLQRETLSRLISALEKEKIIKRSKNFISIE